MRPKKTDERVLAEKLRSFSFIMRWLYYTVVAKRWRELLRVLKKGSDPQEEKSDLHEEKKNLHEEKKNPQEEKNEPAGRKSEPTA